MEIIKKIACVLINLYYNITNAHLHISLHSKVLPGSAFEGYNTVGKKTVFCGRMGRDSYIGEESFLYADVGRFTSIGDRVRTIFGTHPTREYVSTSPVFYSMLEQTGHTYADNQSFEEVLLQPNSRVSVVIGNDVWIASDTLIIGRVTIGDGAVIAAGSVVTKDVDPYSIVGGVPARTIRKRFDSAIVDCLLRLRWWDMDETWIKEHSISFRDIDVFLDECKREGLV